LSCLCLVRYALCFRLYMPLPSHLPFLFFLRRPPTSPLFPYTTLFRSRCSFGSILTRRYSRSSHVPVTSSCVQSCLQISRLRSKTAPRPLKSVPVAWNSRSYHPDAKPRVRRPFEICWIVDAVFANNAGSRIG